MVNIRIPKPFDEDVVKRWVAACKRVNDIHDELARANEEKMLVKIEMYKQLEEQAGCFLTPRQMEILKCVKSRLNNKEISTKLFISERTVKFHLENLFKIYQVTDRQQLVTRAFFEDNNEL